jgi:transposase
MIHVGIDLHHRNSYIRALDDLGELFPGRRIYHDRLEELWQYLGQFGQQAKRVVFEATANSRWLDRLLRQDPSIEPVAVTPHKVRIIAESVCKTDKIDATVLATLSKLDSMPRAFLADEEIEQLREMTRHRADLVALRTRAKNHVNGVLVRQGLLRPYMNIFGTQGRTWLREVKLPGVMRLQVEHWLGVMDHLEERIAAAEHKLYRELALQERWKADVALLTSMPGVGMLTALTILAELGDYHRFGHSRSVACFAGLVPSSKRSDKSCRYGKLTKRGPVGLRCILVEVSLNAARGVPRYGALYESVKQKKCSNVGKAAVARQMLEDAWTMLMKREPFRFTPAKIGGAEQAESLARVG